MGYFCHSREYESPRQNKAKSCVAGHTLELPKRATKNFTPELTAGQIVVRLGPSQREIIDRAKRRGGVAEEARS